jgi:hypothetical protein
MGGANGSRECAPDDKLRDTHQLQSAKMMGFAKGSTHPTRCVCRDITTDTHRARVSASQTPPPIMKPPETRDSNRVRRAEKNFRARPASIA